MGDDDEWQETFDDVRKVVRGRSLQIGVEALTDVLADCIVEGAPQDTASLVIEVFENMIHRVNNGLAHPLPGALH
jgi:hypothetical protein